MFRIEIQIMYIENVDQTFQKKIVVDFLFMRSEHKSQWKKFSSYVRETNDNQRETMFNYFISLVQMEAPIVIEFSYSFQ